jgi:hypothetical protein
VAFRYALARVIKRLEKNSRLLDRGHGFGERCVTLPHRDLPDTYILELLRYVTFSSRSAAVWGSLNRGTEVGDIHLL